MKRLIVTLLLILAISVTTLAQDKRERAEWKKIIQNGDVGIYYDPESVNEADDGATQIWLKMIPLTDVAKSRMIGGREDKKKYKHYIYSLNLQEYDCKNRRYRLLTLVDYSEGMELIKTIKNPSPTWEYVTPDTPGWLILKAACPKKD